MMRESKLRQRRQRSNPKKKGSKSFGKLVLVILGLVVILIVASVVTWKFFLKTTWDTRTRLVVVINQPGEEVLIKIFDPDARSITTFSIPANTQINVSRQMGIWKVGSIWELGMHEKLEGRLLAESITKSFKFPVDAWSDSKLLELTTGKITSLPKAFNSKNVSSLTLKDKININLFSLSTKASAGATINLSEGNYLKKTILSDGEEGYVINGDISPALASYFSDNLLTQINPRIALYDETKRKAFSDTIGTIIQVLGGKVYVVYERPATDTDCVVVGDTQESITKIASVFNCTTSIRKVDSDFDIEIYLGEKFENRF